MKKKMCTDKEGVRGELGVSQYRENVICFSCDSTEVSHRP